MRFGSTLTEQVRRQKELLGLAVTLHNAYDPHDVWTINDEHKAYNSFSFLAKSICRQEVPDKPLYHLGNMMNNLGEVVSLSYRRVVKPPERVFIVGCRAEQSPNPDSRVTLTESKDRFGIPLSRLDWKIAKDDLSCLLSAQKLCAEELCITSGKFLPFYETRDDGWTESIVGGAHHIGTTRMHYDPRMGVVDENCRVHGIHNLYIAGSSVFPTSGWAPPTLTLVALALRLADFLHAQPQYAIS